MANEVVAPFVKIADSYGSPISGGIESGIKSGRVFMSSRLFTAVANDGFADIMFDSTAGNVAHIKTIIATEGKALSGIYKETTYGGGDELLTVNTNSSSIITNLNRCFINGIGISPGTLIQQELIPVAGKTQLVNSDFEVITDINDVPLLFRVQNKAGSAKDISITLLWREEVI